MKQLFLDIETTGFSRDWNEIIEIAGVIYDDVTNTILDTFHEYIKPQKGIPANITELTGITNAQVFDCRPEWEVLVDFADWCDKHAPDVYIGHNCKAFDLNFIAARCNKFHLQWNMPTNIIDTLTYARQLKKKGVLNTPNMQQKTLGAHFGVIYEAHSALNDVMALIEIYKAMKKSETPDRASLGF